jgi:hypothetical protein
MSHIGFEVVWNLVQMLTTNTTFLSFLHNSTFSCWKLVFLKSWFGMGFFCWINWLKWFFLLLFKCEIIQIKQQKWHLQLKVTKHVDL